MEPLSLTARLASTCCICSGSGSVFDTVAGHNIGMCVACVYLTGDSSSCRFCLTTNMTRAERNLTRGQPHSALPHLPSPISHLPFAILIHIEIVVMLIVNAVVCYFYALCKLNFPLAYAASVACSGKACEKQSSCRVCVASC